MKIQQLKKDARASLKGRWGLAVLVGFLVVLISGGIPSLLQMIASGGPSAYPETSDSGGDIIFWLVTAALLPVSVAGYWIFLAIARNEKAAVGDLFQLFSSGKRYFKTIGLGVLIAIYSFLWSLLLIIPGIIKSLAYSQTYFIYHDHPELTLNQMITKSRKMMDGYKWKFFLMQLSFIGWGILCLISIGIGFLWLVPYINTTMAKFYEHLRNNEEVQEI
ncbi:DUF975 family protein [Heyndrickxia acidiproducens]|uniref:DUF975 family protein n=1 Tax=Heyndrickxia acidiproducens TaxID=1121084 RepID=UPI00036BA711|nr:DUF975 family protein [Heyndrickxia acidiproducens]